MVDPRFTSSLTPQRTEKVNCEFSLSPLKNSTSLNFVSSVRFRRSLWGHSRLNQFDRLYRSLHIVVIWLLFNLVSTCVSHVEIEGAPCPCPEGYSCCATLSGCIPSHTLCPNTYSPSSNKSCIQ